MTEINSNDIGCKENENPETSKRDQCFNTGMTHIDGDDQEDDDDQDDDTTSSFSRYIGKENVDN
jgi:hypothetical protein